MSVWESTLLHNFGILDEMVSQFLPVFPFRQKRLRHFEQGRDLVIVILGNISGVVI